MTGKLDLYRALSLARRVAEKIIEVYPTDVMQTPVHLSVGQEAVSVGLCANLTATDLKIGTHRSHNLYLMAGGDLKAFFAELLGKTAGCSGGLGGSMHFADPQHGLVGTTSIVGGCLPEACGLAETVNSPNIVAVLFGDGACDQGVFYESLNWAALRSLPVLFVCENNGLSVETPLHERRMEYPFGVAELFMPSIRVEGFDVYALDKTFGYEVEQVRKTRWPRFVEARVVRCMEHSGVERQVDLGSQDPLEIAARDLGPGVRWAIDLDVAKLVERTYREAVLA